MEVSGRHARTRPITCDTVLPANQPDPATDYASRDVARVVSDVSVLCPRAVVHTGNSSGWAARSAATSYSERACTRHLLLMIPPPRAVERPCSRRVRPQGVRLLIS